MTLLRKQKAKGQKLALDDRREPMKKAGRPPKAPEDRMTQRIYVPATAREVAEFDAEALKQDRSRQAHARKIVSDKMGWKKEI